MRLLTKFGNPVASCSAEVMFVIFCDNDKLLDARILGDVQSPIDVAGPWQYYDGTARNGLTATECESTRVLRFCGLFGSCPRHNCEKNTLVPDPV